MAWAIEQKVTTDPNAKFVLVCLANYADKLGKSAFPSVASLCEDTLLSESTIRRRLDELEEHGLIRRGNQEVVSAYIKREDRRPVCYELAMERGVTQTPRADDNQQTGCQPEGNGVSNSPERGVTVTPNPILKSVNKPKSVKMTFEEEFKQRFGRAPH